MANTKSAKKAIRVSERKREVNRSVISRIRTIQKKARIAVEKVATENNAENIAAAKTAIISFEKEVKKGVTKNIFKLNTASRQVSQLFTNLKKAQNPEAQKEASA
ncbi:30S ribosomal protein S20 [Rickettsiales bacterium]|nr:30S ribosomal protein S20 [Rickettsiales bacterium]MDB2550551.1 30S ribosomal protein S20 [Rickettsiales bacterium]